MDEQALVATRRSLHAVAEQLLAGPQYRERGTIRLRITPGGFAQLTGPWRVEGAELVGALDTGPVRVPLTGTVAEVAAAAGIEPGVPEGLYPDHADLGADGGLAVDTDALSLLAGWFERGDAGLRAFAPDVEPVLWPEHFDLGITVGEVNYGVSPGDANEPEPYAYIGPWTPRTGGFWNAPFGAIRAMDEVSAVDDLVEFFAEGRRQADG